MRGEKIIKQVMIQEKREGNRQVVEGKRQVYVKREKKKGISNRRKEKSICKRRKKGRKEKGIYNREKIRE